MRNAECGMRNAECGMRNAERGMRNPEGWNTEIRIGCAFDARYSGFHSSHSAVRIPQSALH
jgi:hypothetical protein